MAMVREEVTSPIGFRDVAVGSVIAIVMAVSFSLASPGKALLATFVPGVLFAYIVFLSVVRKGVDSEFWGRAAPLYFLALAVQFLHFGEEYLTGFPERFPVAYGGSPFSRNLFVAFNMIAYTIFVLSVILSHRVRMRGLMIPELFFVVYGTWGNAVSHTTWCVLNKGYFPGAVTACIYLIVGPLLLHRYLGNWKHVWSILLPLALMLVVCALSFFSPEQLNDLRA